jgi:putative DNA primase/helicase
MNNIITEKINQVKLENVPQVLKSKKQWILWKYKLIGDKLTKIPINPKTLKNASTTDPSSWTSFDFCITKLSGKFGLGFVFAGKTVGIDIDHVFENETSFKVDQILSRFSNTYIEYSPSGLGFHIFCVGKKTTDRCKNTKFDFEYYDQKRFFTFTGNWYTKSSRSVTACSEALAWFEKTYFKEKTKTNTNIATSPTLTNHTILNKAFKATNGAKIKRLYEGDTSNYASRSEADLALASLLAFYTQDRTTLKQLMCGSGLNRPKFKRDDYMDSTITKAIESLTETYSDRQRVTPFEFESNSFSALIKKQRKEANKPPFLCGYSEIDEVLNGFRYRNLYLVSGLEKSGKSAFLMNMLNQKLNSDNRILFINTELPAIEFATRMTSYDLGLPEEEITDRQVDFWVEKNISKFEYIGVEDLIKLDDPMLLLELIKKKIENIDAIVFDNITSLASAVFQVGKEDYQVTAHFMDELGKITKTHQVVSFVVLHAKNSIRVSSNLRFKKAWIENPWGIIDKKFNYIKDPTTADIYGGGQMLSQASGIIFVWRPFQDYQDQKMSSVAIIKLMSMRHAKTTNSKVCFNFDLNTGKFKINKKKENDRMLDKLKREA